MSSVFFEKCKQFFAYLKGALSVNLGWKIFSLVFAVCIWFVVINITNPKEIWPFTVNLTLSGLENLSEYHNVVVKNQNVLENTPIAVKIRGNRLDLEALNKYRSGITASANLSVINVTSSGESPAPIDIIFPYIPGVLGDAFEVISINPKYAGIVLEDIITEEKTVKVNLIGDVAEGYVALTPDVTPNTVKLRGPRSKLNQIDQVMVETVLSGETGDISVSLAPRLLDRDMNAVEDVDCFTELVDVLIKIDKYKQIPVYAGYVGEPAPGYVVTGISWEPENLEIVGSGEEVNSFNEVRLTPVNVSGLLETNTTPFDIRSLNILPESVSIKNGTPNNVTVTVTIEREIEKSITVPSSMLSTGTLSPEYSYNVLDTEFELTVKGVESVVSGFEYDLIRARIDLEGFLPGEADVPVEVLLPDGITLTGSNPTVRVNITPAQQTEESGDNVHQDVDTQTE